MNELHVTPGEASSESRHTDAEGPTRITRRLPKAFWLIAVVLMIALVIGALTFFQDDEPENESSAAEPSAREPVSRIDTIASTIKTRIGDLERRVEELGTQWALHEEQAGEQIAANAKAVNALQDTVAALPPSDRLAALEKSVDANRNTLSQEIARIEQALQPLQAAVRAEQTEPEQPALPFEVVSVDLWDGVAYVSLAYDDGIALVRAGQSRAGWTVRSIDLESGQVMFRNAQGQTIEHSVRR